MTCWRRLREADDELSRWVVTQAIETLQISGVAYDSRLSALDNYQNALEGLQDVARPFEPPEVVMWRLALRKAESGYLGPDSDEYLADMMLFAAEKQQGFTADSMPGRLLRVNAVGYSRLAITAGQVEAAPFTAEEAHEFMHDAINIGIERATDEAMKRKWRAR